MLDILFYIFNKKEYIIKMSIGKRIKKFRLEKGLTQKELGGKLQKTDAAIRMWELDKNIPDINALLLMCQIFNCSIEYLATGNEYHKVINFLTPQQKQLLDYYNDCDEILQEQIFWYAKCIAKKDKNK